MCLYLYVCVSIPWEESIMNNRAETAWESVNTELFACLRVLPCVCTGKMAAYFITRCGLCVCVSMCVCARQSGSDPLTWQLFLRECTHPCHYCSTHCWLTAFSTAQEMSVSQSVTLLISSQSQRTSVVLTVPTGHWWFMKSILWPRLYFTKLSTYLWNQDLPNCGMMVHLWGRTSERWSINPLLWEKPVNQESHAPPDKIKMPDGTIKKKPVISIHVSFFLWRLI